MRANAPQPGARIGPNAILQLVPVLDAELGVDATRRLLASAGVRELPDGRGLIDEAPAVRLHRALRESRPAAAPTLAARAGLRTGDYILRHRIPAVARAVLRWTPPALGARMLARAIARHAWTFAGSGEFRVASLQPLRFEIRANPLARGVASAEPVCHWHAAVFERLYRTLIAPDYRVRETRCVAQGSGACCFEVARFRRTTQRTLTPARHPQRASRVTRQ